jgi:dTDP-4-amino-4,6-dideoxygalactose transaminase
MDSAGWDSFTKRTGIKVVLDAAAAFDSLRPGSAPAMVSLHATKAFGIGEGGVVIARAPEFIGRVRRRSNFGFNAEHGVEVAGGNYKMSEYAAAVGHAALDLWPAMRDAARGVAEAYKKALEGLPGLRIPSWFGQHAGAYCVVELTQPIGAQVVRELDRAGIESRLWWGRPCHSHLAFAKCKRSPLPNTEWLASRVLNLPFYPDLTTADVLRVRDALGAILASQHRSAALLKKAL